MKRSALMIILCVVTVASVLAATWMFIQMQGALRQAGSAEMARALAERDRDAAREQLAQAPVRDVREQLAQQHAVRESGERAIKDLREQLAQARSEKEALLRSVNDQGGQLGQERSAREAAERALKDAREMLAMERTARQAAEAAVSETGEELIRERTAREAAERAIKDRLEQVAELQRAIKDLRGGHRGLNDLGPLPRLVNERFPPPWHLEGIPGGHRVLDAHGTPLACVYGVEGGVRFALPGRHDQCR
jgi:ElaB/YqjD/DUF883 family membrane-anchored ribosome-binding protein